jgi:hypothetical protein
MPNLAPEFRTTWLEDQDAPTAPVAADPVSTPEDVEALTGRFVQEMAAAWTMAAVHLGDRLGLYRALAAAPATAGELAARTGCHPRLVQEWLAGQVAAGFILLDDARATDHRYSLSPAQALVLADGNSPVS